MIEKKTNYHMFDKIIIKIESKSRSEERQIGPLIKSVRMSRVRKKEMKKNKRHYYINFYTFVARTCYPVLIQNVWNL